MKTKTHFFSLIFIMAMLLQSCYSYRIVPKGVAPASVNADKVYKKSIKWWGISQPLFEPDCHGNGVARVESKTNAGHILVGIVTLGIIVPVKISCWCAKDQQ